MLNKFINSKITDKQLKIIFLLSTGLVVIAMFFLLSLTSNLLDKYYEYSNNTKIIIMDEQGNQFQKTIYQGKRESFDIFATTFVKKIGSLEYLRYDEKINYIKTYTTKEAFSSYNKFIKENNWIQDAELLEGVFNLKIEEIKIKQKENEYFFKTKIFFESDTTQKTYNMYIKIKIGLGQPTENNSIGIFAKKIEFFKSTEIEEKYSKYLKIDKK